MRKILEELAKEEEVLTRYNVFNAIQGSLSCAQKDLEPPRKSKVEYDIAKGEIGHAYLLLNSIEHIENKKFKYTRKIINYYAKQIGYKTAE
jgi:hypothetical protein